MRAADPEPTARGVLGVKVREYATDGTVMGRANVAAWRLYGHDLITIFTDTAILAEALGMRLKFPEDDVARVDRPAVAEPADASPPPARLTLRKAGRLPVYLVAIRHCVQEVGGDVFVARAATRRRSRWRPRLAARPRWRGTIKNPGLAETILEKSTVLVEDFA